MGRFEHKRLGLAVAAVAAVGAGSAFLFGDRAMLPPLPSDEVAEPHLGDDPKGDPQPAPVSLAGADAPRVTLNASVCAPGLLRGPSGCAALSELRSDGQALLAEGALPRAPVRLVSATDLAEPPRLVEGCDNYRALRRAGWGGLSSADMAAEAKLARACGLLELVKDARPIPSAASMERKDMLDLDRATLPGLGALRFDGDAKLTREGEAPQIWQLTGEAMLCRLTYFGTADLDGDDRPEHLVEWQLAAKGGSFRQRGFGALRRISNQTTELSLLDPYGG